MTGTDPDRLTARRAYGDALAVTLEDLTTRYRDLTDRLSKLPARVADIGTTTGAGRALTAADLVADALGAIAFNDANVSLAALVRRAAEFDRHVPDAVDVVPAPAAWVPSFPGPLH